MSLDSESSSPGYRYKKKQRERIQVETVGRTPTNDRGVRWSTALRKATRTRRKMCSSIGCSRHVTTGAHVKVRGGDGSVQVVLLCVYHACDDEVVTLKRGAKLTPQEELRLVK
jgi:hypothetical protein